MRRCEPPQSTRVAVAGTPGGHCAITARASKFCTVVLREAPPRAVRMPRAFGISAMTRVVVEPAACIWPTTGSTFAQGHLPLLRFAPGSDGMKTDPIAHRSKSGAQFSLCTLKNVRCQAGTNYIVQVFVRNRFT